MEKQAFDGLMESLGQAVDIAKGKRQPARTHCFKVPDSIDVKAIRSRMQMTQKQFSSTFGFPLRTLASWESGERKPEKSARILLQVIQKHPAAVLDSSS